MSCGESLYNYINRQIKKISEKQHNFIELQDRVNTNIFIKLDEINDRLLDIGQNNNVDSILNELEKLTTELNIVKENVGEISQNNSVMFNSLNAAILEIKNKDLDQDAEISQINENVYNNTRKLNVTTNISQTNSNSIKSLSDKFDVYEANTDAKIENINNTLNSVVSYELAVNSGTEVNAKQDIFQDKVCSIAGFFKTSHMQSGWSALIQLQKPYPKHDVQFVCFDSIGKNPIHCYINNSGVINFNINYSGEKAIFFNVSYIA